MKTHAFILKVDVSVSVASFRREFDSVVLGRGRDGGV